MALYILNDPEIPIFISSKTQFEISKIKALNRKRITTNVIKHVSLITVMLDDPDAVFLIPEIDPSLADCIVFCNRHNIPVIVLGTGNQDMPFLSFSAIYGHAYENMRTVLRYCIGSGKKRLALFGFNNTFTDKNYAEAIYTIYPDFGQDDFFQITTTFDNCFEKFFPFRNNYDSILFPNDFIAIAFMQKINQIDSEYVKNRFIIGISNTLVSRLYFTTITSITYSRNALLRAVSSIYRTALRNKGFFVSVDYMLPPEFFIRESTQNIPLTAPNTVLPKFTSITKNPLHFEDKKIFYADDPVLQPIVMLENLFLTFDKLDFQILLCLLNGMTNTEISDKLYITPQALQYHFHQMFEIAGTENKREFLKYISRYVSKSSLEKYLEDSVFP